MSQHKLFDRLICIGLAGVFAAAGGCGAQVTTSAGNDNRSAVTDSAQKLPASGLLSADLPFKEKKHWLPRHDSLMKNPTTAAAFNAFLAQFDRYRGQSLRAQAAAVDSIVDAHVDYVSDTDNYGADEYFAAPVQTALSKKGDCEDFATLKYAVMQHLGIGDERLYVMGVNMRGGTVGADHAILALDISKKADTTAVVILDNVDKTDSTAKRLEDLWQTGYRPRFTVNRTRFTGADL